MVSDNPCVLCLDGPSVIEQVIMHLKKDVAYLEKVRKGTKGSFVWVDEND